jgi:hypothetical protein
MIRSSADPFDLVQEDLSHLSDGIKGLLDNDHPVLAACAKCVVAGCHCPQTSCGLVTRTVLHRMVLLGWPDISLS